MFQSFLGHEDHHFHLRNHIVRMVNLNYGMFAEYIMPINKPTIEEQVKHMLRPGTHFKMKAAATLFQIPIYRSVQHGTSFHWNVVAPISLDSAKVSNIDEVAQEMTNISHSEVYHSADHYDGITSLSGKICNEVPKRTWKEDPAVITVAD